MIPYLVAAACSATALVLLILHLIYRHDTDTYITILRVSHDHHISDLNAQIATLTREKQEQFDRFQFPQIAFERSAPLPPPFPPPHRIADEWGLNDEELDEDEAQEIADAIVAEVE